MYSTRHTRHLLEKCKYVLWNVNYTKSSYARAIHTEFKAFNGIFSNNKNSQMSLLRKDFYTGNKMLIRQKSNGDNSKKPLDTPGTSVVIGLFVIYGAIQLKQQYEKNSKNSGDQYEMARDNVISWNQFYHTMLAKGEVYEILVLPEYNYVLVTLFQDTITEGKMLGQNKFVMKIGNVAQFEEKLRAAERDLDIKPDQGVPVVYKRDDKENLIVASVLLLGMLYFLSRKISVSVKGGGPLSSMFKIREAKFTLIDPHMPAAEGGIKFADVAGAHEAKQEIKEFVTFLKSPDVYKKLGAKVPRGALLLGPPGCGKTLLAKAVSTEGNVPFLAMNGPEFIEMIGGVGAARVRDLFTQAKKKVPCIIYIDEIDAIGRKRSDGANMSGGASEAEQTLNQLLVELDGILSKEGIIVLASTNRLHVLDKALLRPGRFDRHIMMDIPNMEERKEIFELHLSKITLEHPPSYYSKRMASLTLGFSGADIANVCNEAAICAARNKKKVIDVSDLEYAIERIIGGTEKKSNVVTPEERKIVAYHESGHALVGWLLEHTDALLKVTIIPRTNHALGFAQYTPKDQKLYNQDEICEKMCMALGGRVAESITFNKVTTGAQNDLEKVTKMAYAQVRTMGFSSRVGQVSFPVEEEGEIGRRPYSKMLANIMDQEVNRIIYECYSKTETLLSANKDKLITLAEALLKRETLNYDDVVELLGPPLHGQKNLIEPLQFENEMKNWKEMANKE